MNGYTQNYILIQHRGRNLFYRYELPEADRPVQIPGRRQGANSDQAGVHLGGHQGGRDPGERARCALQPDAPFLVRTGRGLRRGRRDPHLPVRGLLSY